MSPTSPSRELDRMLAAIRRRLAWAAFGRALLWAAAAGCAAAAGLVPLAWWRPEWLSTLIAAAVPVAALLALGLAWAFRDRPTREDAANRADRFAGTKDLFLTAAELERQERAPAFAPLVYADAAARVPAVDPAAAVPFGLPGRRLIPAGAALAVLVGVLFLVPRVDPFGAVAAAQEAENAAKKSERTAEEAKRRTEELKRSRPESELSPEVAAAVEKLAADLKKTKRGEVQANRKKLAERRADLSRAWRNVSAEQARGLLAEEDGRRTLGLNPDADERKKWLRDLKEGDAESLREALNRMAAEAAEAANESDPAARAEKMQALREQARKLENFARNDVGDDRLAEAMRQAGEQLRNAAEQAKAEANGEGSPEATREAMNKASEAAKAVLEQAGLEAEKLAQAARDMAELEQALEAARQAGQLNEMGQLDGQEATDAASMAEFLEVYEEMLAESGQQPVAAIEGSVRGSGEGEGDGEGDGDGEDSGGEGRGEREEVDGRAMEEAPDAKTGFRTEVSQSHLVAGKTLMSLKSKGDSERGERTTEYMENLARVKDGVDEAIVAEDVPPGYREGIQRYFDALGPTNDDE
ncbi:hypothetical protein [Alienimonas sp. DA493]|uniref:hypothetical protein n=1 Tax=Alienimonas sp. DA493 TaxID=3373605 RepID=UPI0037549E7F